MEGKGDSRYPLPDDLEFRRAREELAERAAQTQASEHAALTDLPAMSGLVVWLARKLGEDPYELAKRFPPDTLRRLKYPFASEQNPDGTTSFRTVGIVEGKQLVHAPTSPGSRRDAARGGIRVKR